MSKVSEAVTLRSVEHGLIRRFGDRVPSSAISAEMIAAVRRFDGARVRDFVPVLVERRVAESLRHIA